MEKEMKKECVKLPCGELCAYNCADNCLHAHPNDRLDDGRIYCDHYTTYFYPSERNGCFNYR